MKIKSMSRFITGIIIIILVIVIVVSFIVMVVKNIGGSSNTPSQNPNKGNSGVVDTVDNTETEPKLSMTEVYKNYSTVAEKVDKVADTNVVAPENTKITGVDIAKINDRLTLVVAKIENTGSEPIPVGTVYDVILLDAGGQQIERFGAVLESVDGEESLAPGASTTLKTQFLSSVSGVAGIRYEVQG